MKEIAKTELARLALNCAWGSEPSALRKGKEVNEGPKEKGRKEKLRKGRNKAFRRLIAD